MVDLITDKIKVENNTDTLNYRMQITTQAATASTLTLTTNSTGNQAFTGTTAGQIVNLGNATTFQTGQEWWIHNQTTQNISIVNFANTVLTTIFPETRSKAVLRDNSTTLGVWILSGFSQDATGNVLVAIFADTANAISNKFLSTENIASSDIQPSVMPGNSSIRKVTFSGANTTASCTLEFRINTAVGTPALSVAISTGAGTTAVVEGLNLSVQSGDRLNCKVAAGATSIGKPLVKCYY